MDYEGEQRPLKLYFLPYLAAGHMIPLCDIAVLFASRGQHVTIITTPSHSRALQTSILDPSLPNLHLHTIPFPSREVGLPDGVESFSSIKDMHTMSSFYQGVLLFREPVKNFIEQHRPDFILADYCYPWMDDLADELGISRLSFNPSPLFTICALRAPSSTQGSSFIIQGLPHRNMALNAAPPEWLTNGLDPLLKNNLKSIGVILNSFVEFEGEEYIHYYEKTFRGHKAWLLGPVSLARGLALEKAERGPEMNVASTDELLGWLSSKKPNSVLYVSFGSLCHWSDEQLYEIACGIEASGAEFIWVVPEKKGKEGESEEEKAKWMPKGFEEKGKILRGWAPQLLILGHPSVGAFLTHSGSNSALEAVSVGVPLITWPVHGDQFYNEKLYTDVRGIGVEVGVDEWTMCGYEKRERVVSREKIEKAVRRLTDGGEEADEIRRRVQKMGKLANEAVRPGGSAHESLTTLIAHLKTLRDS